MSPYIHVLRYVAKSYVHVLHRLKYSKLTFSLKQQPPGWDCHVCFTSNLPSPRALYTTLPDFLPCPCHDYYIHWRSLPIYGNLGRTKLLEHQHRKAEDNLLTEVPLEI